MTNQTPQQKIIDVLKEHRNPTVGNYELAQHILSAIQSAPEEIQVKDAYGLSLLSSEDITDFILQYPNGIRIVKDKGE